MHNRTMDKVFDALRGGGSASIAEITEKTSIQKNKLSLIVAFLQKFRFVAVDARGNIRLDSLTMEFLQEIDKNDSAFYEEITA